MGHNSEIDECEFVGRVSVFFYNSPPGAATKIDTSEQRERERETHLKGAHSECLIN